MSGLARLQASRLNFRKDKYFQTFYRRGACFFKRTVFTISSTWKGESGVGTIDFDSAGDLVGFHQQFQQLGVFTEYRP